MDSYKLGSIEHNISIKFNLGNVFHKQEAHLSERRSFAAVATAQRSYATLR